MTQSQGVFLLIVDLSANSCPHHTDLWMYSLQRVDRWMEARSIDVWRGILAGEQARNLY